MVIAEDGAKTRSHLALTGSQDWDGHNENVEDVPSSVPEPHKVMVQLDQYLQSKDRQEELVQTHKYPPILLLLQK